MPSLNQTIDRSLQISRSVGSVFERRMRAASEAYMSRVREARKAYAQASVAAGDARIRSRRGRTGSQYGVDFAQRSVLFWDTLRQRGNNWIAHEAGRQAAGARVQVRSARRRPHASSGRSTTRWCASFRRAGVDVDDRMRPYIIIDPRAGHGPGIGGFKEDSEVGVALSAGHPVYFVIFYPDPEPGQTLADVTDAEAEFVRIVAERHPDSAKPVLVGNCQGGWAVMMLAAARPDIAGALVINGAPMSYWAGNDGDNPMRYAGGLAGGAWLSLLASDLGGGKFDGAHLVAELREPESREHAVGQVLPAVRRRRRRGAALPRVRALVGRLLPDERGGDPLDRQQPLHRQQAVAGRGASRPGPLFRPQVDQAADHRVRVDGRQHHAAAAGVQLDQRHLLEHRGDQGERPDDRRTDPRGHRPPRHLRVRQGREEGAHADRLGAEVHPGAAAGPVRHGDPRDDAAPTARSNTT